MKYLNLFESFRKENFPKQVNDFHLTDWGNSDELIYMSPGPLKIDNGHEYYSIGIENDKIKTFSKEDIERNIKGRKNVYNNIEKGKTVWWTPGNYNLGIKFKLVYWPKGKRDILNMYFFGRPNSAVGRSIDLGYKQTGYSSMEPEIIEAILKYWDKDKAVNFLKKMNGMPVEYV